MRRFIWLYCIVLTNQNSIQEEIKSRLKLGNACYHSVQNLLSSSLLSKNLKIKIYRTIILPVVLYGCETWSLTLREEHRLKVFENRVLRRIFRPKRDGVTGEWRKLHNEELNDLYSSLNIVLLLLSLALQPTLGFSLLSDSPPFRPLLTQLSPPSYSQCQDIFFNIFSPSFPWSSSILPTCWFPY